MRRLLPLFALLLLAIASTTHAAAPNAPGVNLRWDQCYGDGGAWNKNFACNTNTGSDRMVGSFELASDPASPVSGLEISMDFASVGAFPTWWHFKNVGTCRQTSQSMNVALPAGSANCIDWSDGQAAGGIGSYTIASLNPNSAKIRAALAVPATALAQLNAGQEYFAFNLVMNHAKTVGTGACAGCQTPVVIFLSAIRYTTQVAANDFLMTRGANWLGSQYVSWQSGYPTNITHGCGMHFPNGCGFPYVHFTTVAYDVTNARPSTWGSVKALYR